MKQLFIPLLMLAGAAFGSPCASFTYTVGGAAPTACSIDGGAVTFNSFMEVGLGAGQKVDVTFLDPGAVGSMSGVSFNLNPGTMSTSPYMLGYIATATGAHFTSVNDSATPGGVAAYTYAGTPFVCAPNVVSCVMPIASTSTLMNTGTYTGKIPPSQTLTLDFFTAANDKLSGTPEPGAFGLAGLGFAAIGLIRRRLV